MTTFITSDIRRADGFKLLTTMMPKVHQYLTPHRHFDKTSQTLILLQPIAGRLKFFIPFITSLFDSPFLHKKQKSISTMSATSFQTLLPLGIQRIIWCSALKPLSFHVPPSSCTRLASPQFLTLYKNRPSQKGHGEGCESVCEAFIRWNYNRWYWGRGGAAVEERSDGELTSAGGDDGCL